MYVLPKHSLPLPSTGADTATVCESQLLTQDALHCSPGKVLQLAWKGFTHDRRNTVPHLTGKEKNDSGQEYV